MKMRKIFLLLPITLLLLSGCQESPDEDIVVNKNENGMAEAINETADGAADDGLPERYEDSFVCPGENIQVNVNAKISVLGDTFPVVRVIPHEMTEKEVKSWADLLMDGQTLYEPKRQYSKAELEEMILSLREKCNLDALTEEYGSVEAAQGMMALFEEDIRAYEAMYETAPEEIDRVECDWQFHPQDYYVASAAVYEGDAEFEELKDTYLLEAVNSDESEKIMAVRRAADDYRVNFFEYEHPHSEESPEKQYVDKEQALSMAGDIIDEMGFEDWALWDAKTSSDDSGLLYRMIYTPCFSGTPFLMTTVGDLKSEDIYAANYGYPSLTVNVKNGIISYISYQSPHDTVEVENENVSTLPFDEIYARFKTQMQNQYTISSFVEFGGADAEVEHEMEIRVKKIEKGMFRIKEKNEAYSFLIVPTWVFTGEVFIDGDSWGESQLCYINAIDGSIINPKLGY